MANQESLRQVNLQAAFDILRRHSPITRRDLQRLAGLSWGAASNVMTLLLRRGLVRAAGEAASASGPAPVAYDIAPDRYLLLGIDITPEALTATLCDLRGRVVKSASRPLASTAREPIWATLLDLIESMRKNLPIDEPRGIGIAFAGAADSKAGLILRAPAFEGFDAFPLRHSLQAACGLPVALAGGAACAAYAHQQFGLARDTGDFLLLRLSGDISLATVSGGVVQHGAGSAAGLIGHTVLRPDGPRCACGQNGCLAAYASEQAILDRCREGLSLGLADILAARVQAQPPSLADILAAAEAGDAFCQATIGQAASYTGLALAAAVNMIDPAGVLLTGRLAGYPQYADAIGQALARYVARPTPPQVRAAAEDGLSAAVGASTLLAERVYWAAVDMEPDARA